MEIKQLDGDLLSSTAALIAHQVNCQNSFGSGVAKAVRDKWPVVYEKYKFACEQNAIQGYNPSNLLGKIYHTSLPGYIAPMSITLPIFVRIIRRWQKTCA